ncbi:MAG: hypothetical protein ACREM3_14460 [Candidatus Rokuibacteriota bacterium]
MAGKKTAKSKKSLSIKDMPAKPKGGAAVKGGMLSHKRSYK